MRDVRCDDEIIDPITGVRRLVVRRAVAEDGRWIALGFTPFERASSVPVHLFEPGQEVARVREGAVSRFLREGPPKP